MVSSVVNTGLTIDADKKASFADQLADKFPGFGLGATAPAAFALAA